MEATYRHLAETAPAPPGWVLHWLAKRAQKAAITHEVLLNWFDFQIGPKSFKGKQSGLHKVSLLPGAILAGPKLEPQAYEPDRSPSVLSPGGKTKILIQTGNPPETKPQSKDRERKEDPTVVSLAKNIASGTIASGVHLLAGVRGSGKSTVLNLIEHYVDDADSLPTSGAFPLSENRSRRPLLVRFDLGTTFESKVFLRNLLDLLCFRVRQHVAEPPWASVDNQPEGIRKDFWTRFIGRLGDWCYGNRRWAWLMVLLLCLGVGARLAAGSSLAKSLGEARIHVREARMHLTNVSQLKPSDPGATNGAIARNWRSAQFHLGQAANALKGESLPEALGTRTARFMLPTGLTTLQPRGAENSTVPNYEDWTNRPSLRNLPLDSLTNATQALTKAAADLRPSLFDSRFAHSLTSWQKGSRSLDILADTLVFEHNVLGLLNTNNHVIAVALAVLVEPRLALPEEALELLEEWCGPSDDASSAVPQLLTEERGWNLALAGVVVGVLAIGYANQEYRERVRSSCYRAAGSSLGKWGRDSRLAFAGFLQLLGFLLLGCSRWRTGEWAHVLAFWNDWASASAFAVLAGVFGYFTPRLPRAIPSHWVPNWVPLMALRDRFLVAAGMIMLLLPVVMAALVLYPHWFPDQRMEIWWLAVWAFGLVAANAQLALPDWWELKSRCRGIQEELRRGAAEPAGFSLGGFAEIARLVLPVSSDRPDYGNLETAFLEQEIKGLLRDCAAQFGRVIILVDDVDVLPTDKYGDLMRLLRPLCKVEGTWCLVSVPLPFYRLFRYGLGNDVQSTVQGVWVLGNSDLYWPEWEKTDGHEPFELKPDSSVRKHLPVLIERLLFTRLKWRGKAAKSDDPFDQRSHPDSALTLWLKEFVERWEWRAADSKVRQALNKDHHGPGLRVLLREMERMFARPEVKPFDFILSDRNAAYEKLGVAWKDLKRSPDQSLDDAPEPFQ